MGVPAIQNSRVKSAEAPARARRIARIHLCVENGVLNSWTVHVERGARSAPFGELEEDVAGAVSLAGAHLTAIQAESRQVFAQRAGKQRDTLAR